MSNFSAWSNGRPPPDGKYVVLPSGELQIRNVSAEDGFKTYKCRTKHRWQSYWKNQSYWKYQRQRQRFVCTGETIKEYGWLWYFRLTGETKLSATAGRLVITGRERVKDSGEGQIAKNLINPSKRLGCIENDIVGSFRRSAPLCFHISSGCHSTGLIWDCCFFLWE